jgi:hypothetical protein
MADKRRRDILAVNERGDKKFYTRIGTCFTNDDGSESLLFDALPINGKAYVTDPKRKENDGQGGGGNNDNRGRGGEGGGRGGGWGQF